MFFTLIRRLLYYATSAKATGKTDEVLLFYDNVIIIIIILRYNMSLISVTILYRCRRDVISYNKREITGEILLYLLYRGNGGDLYRIVYKEKLITVWRTRKAIDLFFSGFSLFYFPVLLVATIFPNFVLRAFCAYHRRPFK